MSRGETAVLGTLVLALFFLDFFKLKCSITLIKIPGIALVPFSLISKGWNDRIYRCAAGHLWDIGFAHS